MIIEVAIDDWQLDCCGEPFSVGSEVTWNIHANEHKGPPREVPSFVEDHHDLVQGRVEERKVTGRVLSIQADAHRYAPIYPGARQLGPVPGDVIAEQVVTAERFHEPPEGYTHVGFTVQLEVRADADLPTWSRPRRFPKRLRAPGSDRKN
jgi:hypothetical protein